MYIAINGNLASIQTAENPPEQVKYAANELRYYLGLMTGRPYQVVNHCVPGSRIVLSYTEEIGEDGFRLLAAGEQMEIRGGRRGVIYGVYELLERLGCRFFTPECEKIPLCITLMLDDLNETHIPAMEYREHNYTDMIKHPRFAVKCRLNGSFHPIEEAQGGHLAYAWFVHTFEQMMPPEKYVKDHPEYYALVGGERPTAHGGRFQLCLTNPEVLEICTQEVRSALSAHPKARIISISQNDWGGNCECAQCRAVDEEEGSPAGTLLRFVNAIAEALEGEFPKVIFDTLAYQYTRPAPRHVRPRHNVCVRLCSIECCFSHPFAQCDDGTRAVCRPDGSVGSFITDLEDWARVCQRMYVWDYTTCFAHYPTPHPNWHVLQPNMQTMVKNHVKGVFEQANGAWGGGVDFNELRAYLIAKLLWDPYTDVERHMMEFLTYYYGAAAPFLRKYIQILTDKVNQDDIHVGFNDPPTHGFLTEDMLDQYDQLFDQAENAVKEDVFSAYRVAKARMSIRYVRLKRKAMLKGEHDAEEIRRFFTDWRAFGLTRINEWVDMQTTHRAILEDQWRGESFYDHWMEEGGEVL